MPRLAANRTFGPRGRHTLTGPAVTGTALTGAALTGTALAALLGGLMAAAPAEAMTPTASRGAARTALAIADGDDGQDSGNTLTWSVRPTPSENEESARPNYLLDVEEGEVVEDSIRVRNFGERELTLTIYASDARTTETGAIDLLPAGEEPRDVGAWIELDTNKVTIPAKDFIDVPFTLTVPADAESGDHTGGIVTSYMAPGTDTEGQPVKLDRRLGTRVQVRVDGELRPGLTITDFHASYDGSANPAGKGDMTVTYTVENTGNVRMSAQQVLNVDGALGLTGVKATLNPMPELLPGNSLTMTSKVSGVWPAIRTSSELEVAPIPTRPDDSFPALRSAMASAGSWTMPWVLLLLLLAIGGGTGGAIVVRRQNKAREDKRVSAAVEAKLAEQGAPGAQR